jgi:tetratricopeptide (TPR) repeat protein
MNKKTYWIIGAVAAILLVAGISYAFYQQNRLPKDAILSKDPQLTDQEKQGFRDKITEYQNQLKDNSKSIEEQYKLSTQIGLQYGLLGEYENARDYLLKATRILPDNATAWSQLFVIENLMHAYEQAEKHIIKAIEINPTNSQFWGWRLELERDSLKLSKEELEKNFQDALRQTGEHADILALYAKFLESNNDLSGAVQQYKKAIEKNPANKTIYEAEITRIQNLVK